MKAYFCTMARYGEWATRQLLAHVDALPEPDYRRDVGLYFKSVHGTLNHLLVGEHLLWFPRFAQGVSPRLALNEEAEADRARLRERLLEASARWLPFIEGLPADVWGGQIHYTRMHGMAQSLPYAATLGHVFNHGTHHRGQITAAITALGRPCPELDMVRMLQAQART